MSGMPMIQYVNDSILMIQYVRYANDSKSGRCRKHSELPNPNSIPNPNPNPRPDPHPNLNLDCNLGPNQLVFL